MSDSNHHYRVPSYSRQYSEVDVKHGEDDWTKIGTMSPGGCYSSCEQSCWGPAIPTTRLRAEFGWVHDHDHSDVLGDWEAHDDAFGHRTTQPGATTSSEPSLLDADDSRDIGHSDIHHRFAMGFRHKCRCAAPSDGSCPRSRRGRTDSGTRMGDHRRSTLFHSLRTRNVHAVRARSQFLV